MHSSGSILYTTINRIRAFLDEPTLDAKFSNDYLVRHVITPEISNVMSMITDVRKTPIVVRHQISLTTTGEYYELPPSIGKIYRLAKIDSDKNITNEIPHRGPDHAEDAGWWVEGRELHVRPLPGTTDSTYYVWYTPSGNVVPHYSAAGGTIDWTARTTLTLDTTPDLGDVDHRPGAYIGCIVRAWISDTGEPDKVDERVIESFAIGTSSVTAVVRNAFSAGSWDAEQASVKYEIVPYFMDEIWQAVALSCAINLGTSRNISEKQMTFLQGQLQAALQSAAATFDPSSNETANRPANSSIHNIISKIRWKLPEKIQDNLSDDYLMNVSVIPELRKILTVINSDSETAVVVTQDITTVNDQDHYLLNPNIGRVLRVAKKDSDSGLPHSEIRKRSEKDPGGHGWSLEGNRLSILPQPNASETITVWYTPSGEVSPHYAVDGYLNSTTVVKLSKGDLFSGLLGEVDRRSHSYVGSVIRMTTSTGTVEERVITAHDAATTSDYQGQVTVSEIFTGDVSRACTYEIIPSWWANLQNVVVDSSVLGLSGKSPELGEAGYAALTQAHQASMAAMQAELSIRNETKDSTSRRNSMLHNILEKAQTTLTKLDPNLDYSSDFILRQGINNELNNVISRINNTRSNPYYCTFSITTVKNQQYYSLPSGIGELARVIKLDTSGRITNDLLPRSNYDWAGPGWSIENNMLSFRPYPGGGDTYTIWYIPNGSSWPHYAENGSLDGTRSIFTLTTGDYGSQILGDVDKREGAYVGYVLRVLGSSTAFGTEFGSEVIEERTIKSHDAEAGTVEVERAFSSNIATGTCKYEIVPIYLHAVNEAVSSGTVANLSMGSPVVTQRQQKTLYINYRSAMKTAGDNLSNIQGRVPKHFQKSTVDNEGNWDLLG